MKHVDPYLSAEALGIEEWERDELIALIPIFKKQKSPFDMAYWPSMPECGTACCIGGHMEARTGKLPNSAALRALFIPGPITAFLTKDSRHAAKAILNFMTTGKPDWEAVMASAD